MDLSELKTIISLTHQLLVSDKRFQNEYNGSSVRPLLAVWTDLIGKTPHFLLWFWCDVSLALTLSWTLWELLGIERLIGVFELGDLIECSCHNISNTVYSPIMTQLGHGGHITKKTTRGEKNERALPPLWSVHFFLFFFYCGNSLCDRHFNYGKLFFFPFFQLKRLWFLLGFVPASPKCCTALTCRKNLSWKLFKSPPSGLKHTHTHSHGGRFWHVK